MNIMSMDTPPHITDLWCRDETERQAVMTYLDMDTKPPKPAELIEAERRICEAYYGEKGYDAELAALTERITKGEAHCAANPGDLKSKRLLSELKVKLDKLHEVKVMAALKEYERVSDACGGSWQWPLEAETNAVMDAHRTTNR